MGNRKVLCDQKLVFCYYVPVELTMNAKQMPWHAHSAQFFIVFFSLLLIRIVGVFATVGIRYSFYTKTTTTRPSRKIQPQIRRFLHYVYTFRRNDTHKITMESGLFYHFWVNPFSLIF